MQTSHARARAMILGAASFSLLLAVTLWFSGNKEQGAFVGLWVPSILALGAFVMVSRAPAARQAAQGGHDA